MISVNNVKRACLAALGQSAGQQDEDDAARTLQLVQYFQAPDFYVDNNKLGFSTGSCNQLSSTRVLGCLQEHLATVLCKVNLHLLKSTLEQGWPVVSSLLLVFSSRMFQDVNVANI